MTFNRAKWQVLILLIFCYSFIYCGRQNFGFAILGIQASLHLTTTDTGIISAGMLLFYGIGQAINGNLADRYSARTLILFGIILSFAFNFIASFGTNFWMILIPWCLNGYAQSLGFASGGKLITNWWDKNERGRAFGFYLAASGFSSVIAFFVSMMVIQYFSWQWLFRLPVILLFLSGVIFYIFARDTPAEMGFTQHFGETTKLPVKTQYATVLKNSRFQMACVTMGFSSLARYGLLLWIPAIYTHENSWITLALPLGMGLGCVIAGYASDLLFSTNRNLPVIVAMFAAGILTLTIYYLPDTYLLSKLLLLFLTGLLIYGPQALLFALCPELLGTESAATGVGIMNAYAYGFSAVGEVIIGYLIQLTHNFSIVYIVVTLFCLFGFISSLLIKRMPIPALEMSTS